jgi:hypothetical protein
VFRDADFLRRDTSLSIEATGEQLFAILPELVQRLIALEPGAYFIGPAPAQIVIQRLLANA